MKCSQPALSRELFESASLGELSNHPHLAACPACRREHAQLSRMQAYWDREPLSQSELLRLEMRCRPRQLTKRRSRPVAWAAFGGVVALGTAAAAGGYLNGGFFSSERAEPPSESRLEEALEDAGQSRRANPTPADAPTVTAQPTEEPPGAMPEDAMPEEEPTRERAGQARRTEQPKLAPPTPSVPKKSSAQAPRDPGWIEAAEALKKDDHAAAERALKQLSTSGDAVTRDAARLTLAETYLERGRRQQAEPILRQLAAQGATETIRSRAQKLLQ